MLLCHLLVGVFHHQISHFTPVVLHIEELFAMSSFVVEHIFVTFGAYYPAPRLTAVEACFRDDVILVGNLRITAFRYFAE